MTKTPLVLQTLHVDRLYGRRHDALRLDGLAPGINVVHGPNGQGKTTIGRGLHALVWPASVARYRPTLSGAFRLGDDEWRVDIDGPSIRHQRAGLEAPSPPLADDDERDRYRLSLHDLLRSDGAGFARVVARDAAGGLDVDEATATLRFSTAVPRTTGVTKSARDAWAALDAERRAQQELTHDAHALDTLVREQAEASAAAGLREVWEAAREYAAIRDEATGARAELDALPPALAHTRDDDAATLHVLRETARDASGRAAASRLEGAAAQAVLALNVVARAGRSAPIAELGTLHDAVRDADLRLGGWSAELAQLRTLETKEAERFLGADLDRLFAATLADITSHDDHARQAARLMGFREELAAFVRVEKELPPARPLEPVEAAARLLRDWLRSERSAPSQGPMRLAAGGAIVCALLSVAVGVLVHPAGFALLFGTLALTAIALQLRPAPDDRAAETQTRYERLGVGQIGTVWSRDSVEARLDLLERERADAVLGAQVRARIAARRDALSGIDALRAQVETEGARLASRIGVALRVDGVELAYAIEGVRVYQDARGRRVATETARSTAETARTAALARASDLLVPFGVPAVHTLDALAGALAALTEANHAAAAAHAKKEDAHLREGDAAREAETARTAIGALFARLDLDPAAGDAAVTEACRQRTNFLAAATAASDASAQAAAALRRLGQHPAYTDGLEAAHADEATARRDAAALLAAQAETLTAQLAELRTRIGQAEAAHAVEAAAARHSAALDALRTERDRAVASRLGHLFADAAARTSRELQVPAVVSRAGEILSTITAHRYGLTFDPAAAAFVATDHVLGQGLVLDELSSGTRVQLLLSIRIAFIEQRERGVRLPIVLDELLANSDEDRADAITQAVVALCRDGRQVFYLTSQPDEVAKWRRVADANADVSCAFFALGDGGDATSSPDALPDASLALAVPVPDGRDHAAYGALIGVPGWSAREDVGGLHLWYAIEDPATLYSALAAGVTRLGPALAAVQSGAAAAVGLVEPERLPILGAALSTWQSAWQRGRGRPVQRDAIEASGAISGTFIERVSDLASRHNGDGKALLAALRKKELDRFRQSSADDLEAYLLDTGYLDSEVPLDSDALWSCVVERVGPMCTSEATSLRHLRSFLGRVAAGPPRGAVPIPAEGI